jgi:hypothetical protein
MKVNKEQHEHAQAQRSETVLISEYGGIIEEVTRIGRVEKMHYLFEDGDFSAYRIKKLIREGEEDAEHVLSQRKNRNN